MFKVAGSHRMRMQFDATQIDDPGKASRIVYHDFFRSPARRERERDGPQPCGTLGGSSLLIESFALRAVYESFEDDRAIFNSRESARGDGQVIPNEVELRQLYLF